MEFRRWSRRHNIISSGDWRAAEKPLRSVILNNVKGSQVFGKARFFSPLRVTFCRFFDFS
jgi:hypothetical protein